MFRGIGFPAESALKWRLGTESWDLALEGVLGFGTCTGFLGFWGMVFEITDVGGVIACVAFCSACRAFC